MSIMDKLKKSGRIGYASTLTESIIMDKDEISTDIYALNIVLSGSLKGGMKSGMTMLAGESRSFKTNFALMCAKAYLDKYDDAVLIFYDSEMGATQDYFKSAGIDTDRVLYVPITDIEEFHFDIVDRLDKIERGDHVMIILDSLGNIASKKEVEDALQAKSTRDMSRSQAIASLMRQTVPKLNLKDIPMVVINHVYQTQDVFAKTVVSGGQKPTLNSDNIIRITKSKNKTGNELSGFNFTLIVDKSRYSKEGLKIPVTVNFDSGIMKWSGLIDLALEYGIINKPSNGWYQKVDMSTGEVDPKKYRLSDTNNQQFWEPIINDSGFNEWIVEQCSISTGKKLLSETEAEKSSLVDYDE